MNNCYIQTMQSPHRSLSNHMRNLCFRRVNPVQNFQMLNIGFLTDKSHEKIISCRSVWSHVYEYIYVPYTEKISSFCFRFSKVFETPKGLRLKMIADQRWISEVVLSEEGGKGNEVDNLEKVVFQKSKQLGNYKVS